MNIVRTSLFICCAVAFAACGGVPTSTNVPKKTVSTEQMLADMDAGHSVGDDDITVARFRFLLDQLSRRFPENRARIGDMTYVAQKGLRQDGISESLLTIMEGLNKASQSPQSRGRKYAEYAAAYSTIRANGLSHEKAVDALFKAMSLVPQR